jgi:hypothetical protein
MAYPEQQAHYNIAEAHRSGRRMNSFCVALRKRPDRNARLTNFQKKTMDARD